MWRRLRNFFFSHYARSQNRTVHFAFPIVMFATFFAGLAAIVSETSSFITIATFPTTVQQDEVFYITVDVTANTPVNAVDISIAYDPTLLVVDSIDKGTSVITLWAKEPYAENGRIHLTGGVFQKGFLGKHTIARIKAHATKPGQTYIKADHVSLVAGDGKGSEVASRKDTSEGVKIFVTSANGAIVGKATIELFTDIDGDGNVSLADISIFMSAWFTKSKVFDFNNDGRMTVNDFSILLSDSFFK